MRYGILSIQKDNYQVLNGTNMWTWITNSQVAEVFFIWVRVPNNNSYNFLGLKWRCFRI